MRRQRGVPTSEQDAQGFVIRQWVINLEHDVLKQMSKES